MEVCINLNNLDLAAAQRKKLCEINIIVSYLNTVVVKENSVGMYKNPDNLGLKPNK